MSLLRSSPLYRLVAPALAVGLSLAIASPAQARPKPKKHVTASKSSHAVSRRTSSRSAKASKHSTTASSSAHVAPSAADASLLLPPVPQVTQLAMVDGVYQAIAPDTSSSGARPFASFSASAERMLSAMVDRARSQLGTRYVFGGNTPDKGLDCSSFARFAMQALGIQLPRTAHEQARLGEAVPRDRAMLKPGDLLTFGSRSRVSHVGIYLGEGRFIHASVTSHKIIETTIDRNPRLFKRWQGARRLLSSDDSIHKTRGDG